MDVISRSLKHIWQPCSQMKDFIQDPPLLITKASGSFLYTSDGSKIIDAISSWWCKSLGHNHPKLKAALLAQAEQFEHVIHANTTYPILIALSEQLAGLTTTLDKVFYASEGSSAVEIALKMSLHSRQISGETQRTQIMALANGYHGETLLALAVSDLGLYRQPYSAWLPQTHFLHELPYVDTRQHPSWQDCSAAWPLLLQQLEAQADTLSAIIVEPIVQGAGGMRIYSADLLKRLRQWTQQQGIHLIADEIMTGLGRTGLPLACQHAGIEPDFICLGKGLTGGWLPMSAVLTSSAIYDHFYSDYHEHKAFLHSHTFGGNALAAAVALACLQTLNDERIYQQVSSMEATLFRLMQQVAEDTHALENIRGIGAIVAADLKLTPQQQHQRLGYQIAQEAIKRGALLRPLGNTLYWLPPLNSEQAVLTKLAKITCQAIKSIMKG